MINYYEQLSELRFAEERLENLIEKKEMLITKAMKITSQPKDIMVGGGINSDKFTNYMIQIEGIDAKIDVLVEEIRILKKGLEAMENVFNSYKVDGIERQVFDLIYIKHKKVSEATKIIPCDRTTVYRYKKKIEQKIFNENEKLQHNATKNMVL